MSDTTSLNSIEKLREVGEHLDKIRDGKSLLSAINLCSRMAGEIEQEISEKYMELPVDADGVPIHEGDVIQFVNEQGGTGAHAEVNAVSKYYAYYGEGKHFYKASMCRHVKPRTVEDVLEDFIIAYDKWDDYSNGDDRMRERELLFSRFADDLQMRDDEQ